MLSAVAARAHTRDRLAVAGRRREVEVRKAQDGSKRRTLVTAGTGALLLSGLLVSGCVTISRGVQARDNVSLALEVPAGTPARVETFNGSIEVSASPGTQITAQVERRGEGADQAKAEANRDGIQVTLELVDGVAVLRAVYTPDPTSIPGGNGASVTLQVPTATPLELVTSNGPITVRDGSAGLSAQTSNGPIALSGVAGTLQADTSNGPITVSTTGPAIPELRTSNGGITFDGTLQAGEAALDTSNGAVELRLPADAAFTIDASTSNSKATSEFPIAGTTEDDALRGTVGDAALAAETRLTVRTSNGPIRLLTK